MGVRRALIAGNWKMHGERAGAVGFARSLAARVQAGAGPEIVICPPATLLAELAPLLAGSGIGLGGQDCHARNSGAFTGDISAAMLKEAGCSHVILGHSERRAGHGESDALVKAKAVAAIGQGLTPIICVGETEADCAAGRSEAVLAAQIAGSIPKVSPDAFVIAYEPIWAIGTGKTPSLSDIDRLHRHLRVLLAEAVPGGAAVRLLYGGSVKPANAGEILAREDVDGALVGGASLALEDFQAIIEAAPER
jgi:triosephosphate isomerase